MNSVPWLECTRNLSNDCSALNVVVLYEDPRGGENAVRTLNTLSRTLWENINLCVYFWPSKLLENRGLFSVAINQGIKADILVIAPDLSSNEWNTPLKRWVKTCFALKRGTRAAVVAVFDRSHSDDPLHAYGIQFVHQAAIHAGLSFFVHSPGTHSPENSFDAPRFETEQHKHYRSHPDKLSETFTLNEPYHHWGINE